MNAIRQTQALNKRELENATTPAASWHADYRDTAYIYIGGLNLDLTEGDVVTIFSQFGNPTHLNLIRDKETGKSKGFAFLKYEDQRSCDLAVDNLTGADVLGRLLRVDHTRYKKRDDEDEDTYRIDRLEAQADGGDVNGNGKRGSGDDYTDDDDGRRHRRKKHRPMLKEERELEQMLAIKQDGEEEQDPMRDYLIREKKEQVERVKEGQKRKREKSEHKHRHRRRRDDEDVEDEGRRRHRHRHREEDEDRTKKEHQHRRRHGDGEEDDDAAEDEERRHRHRDHRHRDEENHAGRSDRKRRSDRDRDADRDHGESRSSHRGRDRDRDEKREDRERRRKRSDSRDRDQS